MRSLQSNLHAYMYSKINTYSFVHERVNKYIKRNIIPPTLNNINNSRHSFTLQSTFVSPCNKYSHLNEALLYFCSRVQSYSSEWLFTIHKLHRLLEGPLEDRSLFQWTGLYKLSGHAKMADWVRLWAILWLQRLTVATSNSSHFRSMSHSCNLTTRGALHTQTLLSFQPCGSLLFLWHDWSQMSCNTFFSSGFCAVSMVNICSIIARLAL